MVPRTTENASAHSLRVAYTFFIPSMRMLTILMPDLHGQRPCASLNWSTIPCTVSPKL